MSDRETPAKSDKVGAWTEEAKNEFYLRIIAQLTEDGKTINWQKINMTGRTTKSLQNQWTKVRKAVNELEGRDGTAAVNTPKKVPQKKTISRTPRVKKSAAIVKEDDSDGLDETNISLSPSQKRAVEGNSFLFDQKKVKIEGPLVDND